MPWCGSFGCWALRLCLIFVRFLCNTLWFADDDEAGDNHDEEEDNKNEVVNDAHASCRTQESEGFKTSPVKKSPILTPDTPPVVDSTYQVTTGPRPAQILDSSSAPNTPPSTSIPAQTTTTSMSQNISSVTPTSSTAPSAPEDTATEVS